MTDEVAARDALRTAAGNQASRWPTTAEEQVRLLPEAWPVLTPRFKLNANDTVFTVGSCFARNIERYLDRYGLNVPMLNFSLPEGELVEARPQAVMNKYTPASIYQEFKRTADLLDCTLEERRAHYATLMLEMDDGVVDLELVSRGPVTMERALERREEVFQLFTHAFSADAVTITLGLIECWWDTERQMYVHPMPPLKALTRMKDRFKFKRMRYPESLDYIQKSVDLLNSVGKPDKRILMTTSPVPLNATFSADDVIIANMYSKAQLRAVAGDIYRDNPNVDYFPSFESVILSRSQGIWTKDQIHISDAFVGKIVDHLLKHYLPEIADGNQALSRGAALAKMGKHQEAGDILEKLDGNPRAKALLAHVKGGSDNKSVRRLVDAVKSADMLGDEYLMIGQRLMASGKNAAAAEVLAKGAETTDVAQVEQVGLYLSLGRARRMSGDLAGALAALREAEKITPNRFAVLREIAKIAVAQKDHSLAIAYIDKVLKAPRSRTLKPASVKELTDQRALCVGKLEKAAA